MHANRTASIPQPDALGFRISIDDDRSFAMSIKHSFVLLLLGVAQAAPQKTITDPLTTLSTSVTSACPWGYSPASTLSTTTWCERIPIYRLTTTHSRSSTSSATSTTVCPKNQIPDGRGGCQCPSGMTSHIDESCWSETYTPSATTTSYTYSCPPGTTPVGNYFCDPIETTSTSMGPCGLLACPT